MNHPRLRRPCGLFRWLIDHRLLLRHRSERRLCQEVELHLDAAAEPDPDLWFDRAAQDAKMTPVSFTQVPHDTIIPICSERRTKCGAGAKPNQSDERSHYMNSTDSILDEDLTTPAGKRFLSSALTCEMLWRFAQLTHGEAEAGTVMNTVTRALRGEHFDSQQEFAEYARSAIVSRDLIEQYLEKYHSDMVKLGASAACCERELIHALRNLHKISLVGAEAVCAIKH